MVTRRREQFVHAQAALMLAALVALAAFDSLSYRLYFVVSLVGFLVVLVVTAPLNVTPHWRRRLRWIALLGLLAFGYLIVRRVLEALPPGVL